LEIVPGITSALSCSSLLGAPIVEDFCTISLSDYMVSWDKIVARLKLASEADFVIALYNPKSRARADYLQKALDIMLQYRSKGTPVGIVRNAYREEQSVAITTLGELNCDVVDMFCTLVIGNSNTYISNGYMVTARGYDL
jgi:precorrin-3B C17-methyltransferase